MSLDFLFDENHLCLTRHYHCLKSAFFMHVMFTISHYQIILIHFFSRIITNQSLKLLSLDFHIL